MAASNIDDRDDNGPGDSSHELGDDDVASRWAEIVSTLGDLDISPSADAADESVATSGDTTDDPGDNPTVDSGQTSSVTLSAGPRDWPLTPSAEAREEADAHFIPPQPPPVLSHDPLLTTAWSIVVGVPVLAMVGLILSAAIPSLAIPPLVGQISLGLFLIGLGVLIWRMPHRRDPDDNDPGAVV